MAKSVRETFGHNLELARKRYGQMIGDPDISQAAVAKELLMEAERYRKYERGEREPPLDILVVLARFYGCSVDELLGLSSSPTTPAEAELVAAYRRTTETNRVSLLNIARSLPAPAASPTTPTKRLRAQIEASLTPVRRRDTLHEEPAPFAKAKA